jgi:hypothetical protein
LFALWDGTSQSRETQKQNQGANRGDANYICLLHCVPPDFIKTERDNIVATSASIITGWIPDQAYHARAKKSIPAYNPATGRLAVLKREFSQPP